MSADRHSRTFSFVRHQAHRLRESLTRGWRHLRVGAMWTAEVIFYPFYQLGAAVGRAIAPKSPSSTSPQGLDPSAQIDRVLEIAAADVGYPVVTTPPPTIEDWSHIDEDLWDTAYTNAAVKTSGITITQPAPPPILPSNTIRGITSTIIDRRLALVTIDNQILDILTPQQEQKIHASIPLLLAAAPDLPSPRPTNTKKTQPWWRTAIDRQLNPTFGLVAGSIALDRPPQTPSPPTTSITGGKLTIPTVTTIVVPPPLLGDKLVAPKDNTPLGKLKRSWQFYREYLSIDPSGASMGLSQEDFTRSYSAADYQPDWIETDAEDLGYARSIVTRFLMWLDRVVLAIEDWAIALWQKISGR
jgi:hypothetical protein